MLKECDDYSWILRGEQRKKILGVMDNPMIPTQIKEKTDLSLNNVSDVLREFRKKGVAKCINPEQKTGRLYELTEKGKKLRTELKEQYN
jgi:DNA-binding MarR family transcriptional regulator